MFDLLSTPVNFHEAACITDQRSGKVGQDLWRSSGPAPLAQSVTPRDQDHEFVLQFQAVSDLRDKLCFMIKVMCGTESSLKEFALI